MKILCVHNFYGSAAPSGENVAYQCELDTLRKFGHKVIEYATHSDELRGQGIFGNVRGALSCIWNPSAVSHLRRMVIAERPDIMHVHNVFPRLSPMAVAAAAGTSTATVLTLHNYRLFCSAGTATRGGHACKECADKPSVLPALRYRCYRGSALATLPVAVMIAAHRKLRTYTKNVDAFIALTEFQRQLLAQNDMLPLERTYVRPNFMPGVHIPIEWGERNQQVAFVGRLTAEKGAAVLIDAWKILGPFAPKLVIVGDGADRDGLEREAAAQIEAGQIEFLGQRTAAMTLEIIRKSRLVLVPSMCFEGFPMVIREAFCYGVPVVASDLGALPQIVADSGSGAVFPAGNTQLLADLMSKLWMEPRTLREMSQAAVRAYESMYSEGAAHARLLDIYAAAKSHRLGLFGEKTA